MPGTGRLQPIRYRSLLVVAVATMLFGALTTSVLGATIAARSFERLERSAVTDNISRLQAAYDSELGKLAIMAGDWGIWDDTYHYVLGEQPDYVTTNLTDETLDNLGAHVVAFYAVDGTLIHAAYLDPLTGSGAVAPPDISALSGLVWPADLDVIEPTMGLVVADSGLIAYGAHPITTSDAASTPVGLVLFGRYIDSGFVDSVSTSLRLDVARVDLDTAINGDSDADPWAEMHMEDEIAYGTRLFPDIHGEPALALRFAMSRSVADQGRRALGSFALALALGGLVLLSVLLAALRQERRAFDQQRVAEEAAARIQTRYRALVDGMADAVLGLDAQGAITFANPAAVRLLGRSCEELETLHYRDITTPDSAEVLLRDVLQDRHADLRRDLVLVDADGATITVEAGIGWFSAGQGAAEQMQWILRDVSDRKRFERELLHLATHDHLTGLSNRLRFEEELEQRLNHARRGDGRTLLLWLDLDNFKEVNDSLGHKSGDDLLVALALELSNRLRSDSVLARLGGDEFGILMPVAEAADVRSAAARVLDDIRSLELSLDAGPVRTSASIGVVLLPDHATTAEEALARADIAMYRAKADGGNRFCVFEPGADWQHELRIRFDWAGVIESAIREDRIAVFWQPIVDLATGGVDRYELLVRLMDDQGELIPPGAFLPLAEQLGMIGEIDSHMVRKAIALLSEYPPESGVRIDVNCSGRALSDISLLELIAGEIRGTGVDPGRLGIEITETAAVVDMMKAHTFIASLKSIGVRVALDDFGSGFSSFHYLRNLPVDMLKIDGSFVRELPSSPRDQHIVRSMVELAAGLGIGITAEWVESEETLRLLRSFGVGYAQGYFLGRPCEAGTGPKSID